LEKVVPDNSNAFAFDNNWAHEALRRREMIDQLNLWIQQFDPSVRPGVVTGIATLFAAFLGFSGVILTIRQQGKNAIRQNKVTEAVKLKVQIYREALETSQRAASSVSDLTSFLRTFQMALSFSRGAKDANVAITPPKARFPDYLALHNKATAAIIEVVLTIESWFIIEPKLDVFRSVISMGLDAVNRLDLKNPNPMMYGMPTPGLENAWEVPTAAVHATIKQRVDDELYQVERLAAWISDFQVEMQILLLGELFPNAPPRRDPPDPDQFCVRLDRYDEIEQIVARTEWGQRRATLEAEAWDRFK
jgi:hypothetical protein